MTVTMVLHCQCTSQLSVRISGVFNVAYDNTVNDITSHGG